MWMLWMFHVYTVFELIGKKTFLSHLKHTGFAVVGPLKVRHMQMMNKIPASSNKHPNSYRVRADALISARGIRSSENQIRVRVQTG